MSFVNIGFGNMINCDKVCTVVAPEAAPIKRLIQTSKDEGSAVDATRGRKTKSVIVLENKTIVLSALLPETVVSRIDSEGGSA